MLQVGPHSLNEDDHEKISALVSDFLGSKVKVVRCGPPPEGRNSASRHWVLYCEDGYRVGVKRAYDQPSNLFRELLYAETAALIQVSHCKVKRMKGFPTPDWQESEFAIYDWGPEGVTSQADRLTEAQRSTIRSDPQPFVSQYAGVCLANYVLAIGDRALRHLIWNGSSGVLYSIDHELPAGGDERATLSPFSQMIKQVLTNDWYDHAAQRTAYSESSQSVWRLLLSNVESIEGKYSEFQLSAEAEGFRGRIRREHDWILQQIFV